MAVIKVGAYTETEMKEKKAGVEDALHATRAAVEEGIVPGRRRGACPCVLEDDSISFRTCAKANAVTAATPRATR
jgi:hypothetical protein